MHRILARGKGNAECQCHFLWPYFLHDDLYLVLGKRKAGLQATSQIKTVFKICHMFILGHRNADLMTVKTQKAKDECRM